MGWRQPAFCPRPRWLAGLVAGYLGIAGCTAASASGSRAGITVDFAVAKPVTIPAAATVCATQLLMRHDFASSYGQPFVGNYTPPDPDPACDFDSVVVNFTTKVAGVQYDRLAIMYLTDTEVWRTSTAEPTEAGIVWNYAKDMSQYLALWRQPQTLIFELDNIYSGQYTGIYNTTMTATFFVSPVPARNSARNSARADAILPISARLGSAGQQSVFTIPSSTTNASVKYAIPANVTRAAVSIAANGQIDEEFWYTNVFTSQVDTFLGTAGPLLGGGPFREVQLRIDGLLAGVVWPFPVIFTGGVAPGFWRPIVGIQAFDLVESEIDVTPFLPLLTDGREHTFALDVLQLADNGSGNGTATLVEVESYWLATGKIFLFYGEAGEAENANSSVLFTPPTISGAGDPDIQIWSRIVTTSNGTNETLAYTTRAQRSLTVSSSAGSWTQQLAYSNAGFLSQGGYVQANTQLTTGTQRGLDIHAPEFDQTLSFSYPIDVNTTYGATSAGITIDAALTRGFRFVDTGRPDISVFSLVAGPATLDAEQIGTASYSSMINNSYSFGTTAETFTETSRDTATTTTTTYSRDVKGVNGTVVSDSAVGDVGQGTSTSGQSSGNGQVNGQIPLFGAPRGMIGRGPGSTTKGL